MVVAAHFVAANLKNGPGDYGYKGHVPDVAAPSGDW